MGQHHSNFELATEARRAAERFDETEIKVIKETFRDLCHVNGNSTRIDKETFLQYLPLPGLLGERLFAVFDKKNSGEIDYEEFVCGLAVTCRGTWEEKVEFIFNLYDVHGQGAVNREELAALLNHVPKSIMRFGRAVSLEHTERHVSHPPNCHRYQPPARRPVAPSRLPRSAMNGAPALAVPGVGGVAVGAEDGVEATSALTASGGDIAAPSGSGSGSGSAGKRLTSTNLMQLELASMGPDESSTRGSVSGAPVDGKEESTRAPVVPLARKQSSSVEGPRAMSAGLEEGGASREEENVTVSTEGGTASPLNSNAGNVDGSRPPVTLSRRTSSNAGQAVAAAAQGVTAAVAAAAKMARFVPRGGSSSSAAVEVPKQEVPPDGKGKAGCGGGRSAARIKAAKSSSMGLIERGARSVRGVGSSGGVVSFRDELAALRGCGAARVGATAAAAAPVPLVAQSGSARDTGAARGGCGGVQVDESTDDGTVATVHEHPHHVHWEEFTNNDIVDQAFEDCDLNHNGKLSFSEFRLWVERNPIVTQFLQSVFPYDEHREWGDDRKHLPFIHNKEFTGSPLMSEAGYGAADEDEEARHLLVKARNTARDPALRDAIDSVLEQASTGFASSTGADGGVPLSLGPIEGVRHEDGYGEDGRAGRNGQGGLGMNSVMGLSLMDELSPRSSKILRHQTVAKEGFLWKQGHRLKSWKQRWYVLVGNCIYYYQKKDDVYPCRVVFLLGAFVEPLQDAANERKGFWGIEISRSNENHRRKLYTKSKMEQMKWIKELRKASGVVPIEDDFEIGEELGEGRFSRVCMCVNKHTLERKAVKIINKKDMRAEEKDMLAAEIAIMKLVNHPNIIRMEAVYESKENIYIVMELHSGGELFDRIVGRPRFTEDEAFTVIHPLVEAVAYLHEMGIVHRDIKPENILCGSRIGDIKIADFGLSKMVMPDEIMKMPCGTLMYVAPEVLTLNGYGKEADVWSVGTIMYLLLRGRLPFDGESREEIIENTIHGNIAHHNDHVWANFSEGAKELLLGMLNKDVTQRFRAKDVLRHRWITERVQRSEEHPEQIEF